MIKMSLLYEYVDKISYFNYCANEIIPRFNYVLKKNYKTQNDLCSQTLSNLFLKNSYVIKI